MMTPQQAAEKKYPYITGFGDLSDAVNRLQTDQLREAYIEGLQDAPQLSRSVLEEVRERCAESVLFQSSATTGLIKAIRAVNLDDLLPVGDGWVGVKDRLPDDNERVICFDGKQIQTAKYWADTSQWFSLAIDGFMKVTHWQPLPKAPNS